MKQSDGSGAPASSTFEKRDVDQGDVGAIVRIGEVINQKYRVDRILGSGGMGVVVEAFHLGLEERVALKFLHRDALKDAHTLQRFELEAKAASKLKSEHVAKVTDVDKRSDGVPFMVMEYLEGSDLARVTDEGGPLKLAEAVEYVVQACEGLSEAHSRGIVHRDIKPENLFLVTRSDGWKSVKVVDFGISKAALLTTSQVRENPGALMGSPYYMSPEQLKPDHGVDPRADIWALGAVLFELLTARTVFDEVDDFAALFPKIMEGPNRQLLSFRADAPLALQDVINTCLEKDPKDRYQTAAELAVALLPFAPKRSRVVAERAVSLARAAGHDVVPPLTSFAPPSGNLRDTSNLPTMAPPAERRQRRLALVGLVTVAVLGAIAAAFFFLQDRSPLQDRPGVPRVDSPTLAPSFAVPSFVSPAGPPTTQPSEVVSLAASQMPPTHPSAKPLPPKGGRVSKPGKTPESSDIRLTR